MNQDYTVKAAISYNLEDALEEMAQISRMFRPNVEVDETEFKARMAHLYSHLNTAWNMRNAGELDLESADAEQMRAWSRFPTDLDPLFLRRRIARTCSQRARRTPMSTDRTAEMLNYLSAVSREVGEFRQEFNAHREEFKEHRAETNARLERSKREQPETRQLMLRLMSIMSATRADVEELQDWVEVLER